MRLEDALPLMEAAFSAGAPFRFFPRGTSMLPMLRQGMDSVLLISPKKMCPGIGDVILYRRKNGDFVLHRIVGKCRSGGLLTAGDNQGKAERDVSLEGVLAVLAGFYREDKFVPFDDPTYVRYIKRRMRSRPLRYLKYALRKIIK